MILVTGATGNVGGKAASILASRGLPTRLLVRDPARAPRLPGTELAVGDYADDAAMARALDGVETAFVVSAKAPPGERAALHGKAFETAKRAGVRHVVYLSLQGAAPDSSYPYSRDHWRSERLLQDSGLSHTILRNGKYAEEILGMIGDDGVVRGPADEGRVAWITREDSARMVAAVLQKPPTGTLEYAGPEALTLDETMAILSSVVDRRLSYAEETQENARGRARMRGEPEWRADLAAGAYRAIADGDYAATSDAFERLVGAAPTPFWRWAVGNPALDRWQPSLSIGEETARETIEDLGWIDDLDDPAVQAHLGFLARQYEGIEAAAELIEAFLRVFERFPESPPDLEGNQTALFVLAEMPGLPPHLLRSLSVCPSAVGTALLVQLLATETVCHEGVDLRGVLSRIARDRAAPPRAHREAVDWLEDPHIEAWLRVPGAPVPDL